MGRNEEDVRPVKRRKKSKQLDLKPQVISFSCMFCNESFATTNGLFDHMRLKHLCNIPQITADSEIVEEITEQKSVNIQNESEKFIKEDPPTTTTTPSPPVWDQERDEDDKRAMEHKLIKEEDSFPKEGDNIEEGDEEEEEELESPPYEKNSDAGSTTNSDKESITSPNEEDEDEEPEEDEVGEDDDDQYLSLMEPICELNCNESEAEDFQAKLLNGIKTKPGPGRGRRIATQPPAHEVDLEGNSFAGEAFFKCFVCNKAFHFAGELARHVRSHTFNKPYQCSVSW